ncbi:glycosyltransferase family 9 protein [Actinocrispum sp. NPDC049592]|uniref:glycosyltransferase family 9 protein n=1 Tax=Actinocrispum sp. NPDC049592 TaxID=3154835 RepID=UPI00341B708A
MNILVLRALGLGDLLTAVPALRALRRAYPAAVITLAAPTWLKDAVDRIDAVDRLLPTPELAPIPWQGPPPDLAVNLHGRGPQSTQLLRAVHPRQLITHTKWVAGQHEVDRWCRLLQDHGIPADPADLRLDTPNRADERTRGHPDGSDGSGGWPEDPAVFRPDSLDHADGHTGGYPDGSRGSRRSPADPGDLRVGEPDRVGVGGERSGGPVVVHPGASHGSRRWPAERYAEVARALGPDVVVTGSAAEAELVESVAQGLPVRIGGSLGGLLDLVAHARLVVCGDTGVAHVATAYGTPSVVLFGPVSPALWGPRAGPHKALWHGRSGDTFAHEPDPGLLAISADQVLEEVKPWLHNGSSLSARATSV